MNEDEGTLSLLQLGEKCLAESRMIFLVADLRLLSSTGRINTKYDALSLDSDRFLRTTYEGMACLGKCEARPGLTPSHIMAILLLEMNKSFSEQLGDDILDQDDISLDEEGLLKHIRLSRSDPVLARKAEGDVHTLLQAYIATMREDLATDLPKVPNKLSTKNITTASSEDNLDFLGLTSKPSAQYETETGPEAERKEEALLQFNSLGAHIFGSVTVQEHSGQFCDRDDLVKLLKHAIAERDFDMLDFLVTFFKEGSVTRMMAESRTELVWLHDWHPQKECTYAISVDREERTVMVVFRGATTYADWDHSVRWRAAKVDNPIEEDYPYKSQSIKLHGGYYRYLFRKRKDTKTTKYDEIASKVSEYGAQIGDGYRVVVTGHSLGGALTNIFCFFASLEDRFVKNGPVQAVTFGCPKMAAYQFADAVRHQEDVGKLQVARFHNRKDAITHVPPQFWRYSKRGAKYYHIGLDVELPLIRNSLFAICGQPRPEPRFLDAETFWPSYRRQWREFYGFNLPVRPWMLAHFHSLLEHQQRMLLAESDATMATLSLAKFYERRLEFTSNLKHSLLAAPGPAS